MKELKRFDVLSVGKIFGLFGLVVSVIQMIIFKFISMNPAAALAYGIDSSALTFNVIILGIVTATAIYFISGLAIAFVYNLIARHIGGIVFDLSDAKKKANRKSKKK
tara:strand:+ start:314 stop:634 length:321 start_codon:yes stop_codon:yes gene_type:complete